MISQQWVMCPVCGNKTRTKIRKDTKLINFPLYCPKCRKESLINVKNQIVTINVNIKMYIFDHLRMYIFAILPLDRYIFLSDKIFL